MGASRNKWREMDQHKEGQMNRNRQKQRRSLHNNTVRQKLEDFIFVKQCFVMSTQLQSTILTREVSVMNFEST